MGKATFKVEYDKRTDEVVDDISKLLGEFFGLEIVDVSEPDSETLTYEIISMENQKANQ